MSNKRSWVICTYCTLYKTLYSLIIIYIYSLSRSRLKLLILQIGNDVFPVRGPEILQLSVQLVVNLEEQKGGCGKSLSLYLCQPWHDLLSPRSIYIDNINERHGSDAWCWFQAEFLWHSFFYEIHLLYLHTVTEVNWSDK